MIKIILIFLLNVFLRAMKEKLPLNLIRHSRVLLAGIQRLSFRTNQHLKSIHHRGTETQRNTEKTIGSVFSVSLCLFGKRFLLAAQIHYRVLLAGIQRLCFFAFNELRFRHAARSRSIQKLHGFCDYASSATSRRAAQNDDCKEIYSAYS
jgi:hypothetical protein